MNLKGAKWLMKIIEWQRQATFYTSDVVSEHS